MSHVQYTRNVDIQYKDTESLLLHGLLAVIVIITSCYHFKDLFLLIGLVLSLGICCCLLLQPSVRDCAITEAPVWLQTHAYASKDLLGRDVKQVRVHDQFLG